MKPMVKKSAVLTGLLVLLFVIWTILVRTADRQPIGPDGAVVGLAALNGWFHSLTGVHLFLYRLTDILELPMFGLVLLFGGIGVYQLWKRRNLWRVDSDILLLGGYYLLVLVLYVLFDKLAIHVRPILIDGKAEPSYPSSTTLLMLSVCGSALPVLARYLKRNRPLYRRLETGLLLYAFLIVLLRTVSGVHWLCDIIGSVLLSMALISLFITARLAVWERKKQKRC